MTEDYKVHMMGLSSGERVVAWSCENEAGEYKVPLALTMGQNGLNLNPFDPSLSLDAAKKTEYYFPPGNVSWVRVLDDGDELKTVYHRSV